MACAAAEHCVCIALNRASLHQQVGARTGLTWAESLVTMQEARLAQAARDFRFDSSLAPYNLAALQQWRSLSGYITGALIQKVAPLNRASLSVTTEADPFLKAPKTAAERSLAQQLKSIPQVGSGSGQSAPEVAPKGADAAESDRTGSAFTSDEQGAVRGITKGIGRCFYTVVPSKATVGHQSCHLCQAIYYCNACAIRLEAHGSVHAGSGQESGRDHPHEYGQERTPAEHDRQRV